MNFNTDRQTIDELNLLGKFKQGSVYHLFNQVKTSGGARLLDDMFRYPLLETESINRRSEIFRFFGNAKLDFSFDAAQLNVMREFLDTGTGRSFPSTLISMATVQMLSRLTRDERYKKMVQGLQSAIVTMNKCYAFLQLLKRLSGPYEETVNKILQILSNPPLEAIRNTDIYRNIPLQVLARFDHLLKTRYAADMELMLQFIYEVDVYIAVSDVARKHQFSYAHAVPPEQNCFHAKDLFHPCIPNAVGNDISMNEKQNLLFLTGANMAGKSTLMKSIGIGLYLAHMGFPVAAASMEFSVREGMYSSINVADNIGLGYSHFYAEVVRVKQAAEAAASGKRLLLMFDELFKGTNVKDAYDGTLGVTEAFADYRDCLFIVSTHIIEVGEVLRATDNIRFVFMPTVMEGLKPRYTYRLEEGITEDRQGMMIIRNEGILDMIRG